MRVGGVWCGGEVVQVVATQGIWNQWINGGVVVCNLVRIRCAGVPDVAGMLRSEGFLAISMW